MKRKHRPWIDPTPPKPMTATEYAEINRQFHNKFNMHTVKTGRPPTTCYISGATWNAIRCYFFDEISQRTIVNKINEWNGLPVVRVMDENYFELR
jgi:hypothetical protein